MKSIILALLILGMATSARAQCIAEVKDVIQDPIRGSIIVETEYTLNGEVVQLGKTRYLETTGTVTEIITKAKEDIKIHCENLIRRIPVNRTFFQDEKLKRQKELTIGLITSLNAVLKGHKPKAVNEAVDTFKGKDIKVTYDSKNTITDSP